MRGHSPAAAPVLDLLVACLQWEYMIVFDYYEVVRLLSLRDVAGACMGFFCASSLLVGLDGNLVEASGASAESGRPGVGYSVLLVLGWRGRGATSVPSDPTCVPTWSL